MWIALAVVVVLILGLVAYIASRPAEFRIERSRAVAAPADAVFGCVNDFHVWPEWSPWEKLDPDLKREHSGSPSGPGAVYSWIGNKRVGEGRMTITDSHAPRDVAIRLEFLQPWQATNQVVFDFVPSGSGTKVTWSMVGKRNFMMKAFGVLMNMDDMIGRDFEKGLADLDAASACAAQAGTPS